MNIDLRNLCHSVFSSESLRRSETSVPDLGLRRGEEGFVDFGVRGT